MLPGVHFLEAWWKQNGGVNEGRQESAGMLDHDLFEFLWGLVIIYIISIISSVAVNSIVTD
jgi:hypothetical protein